MTWQGWGKTQKSSPYKYRGKNGNHVRPFTSHEFKNSNLKDSDPKYSYKKYRKDFEDNMVKTNKKVIKKKKTNRKSKSTFNIGDWF